MKREQNKIDWHQYAEKYDMLLHYNPFYKALQREIMDLVKAWSIHDEDLIVDVGAGTGNYSMLLAKQFPQATVIHIDNNEAMNALAGKKMKTQNLQNLSIRQSSIDDVIFQPGTVQGLISVHALYTFPDPQQSLRTMYEWMQSGGSGILVDPGRIVNVVSWQLAIGRHLVSRYGLSKTLHLFREGKVVSQQNRYIRRMQKQGKLWTHSPEEFTLAVTAAGFTIEESRTCFRNLSDLVVVTKS